jgi:hypothetical protein
VSTRHLPRNLNPVFVIATESANTKAPSAASSCWARRNSLGLRTDCRWEALIVQPPIEMRGSRSTALFCSRVDFRVQPGEALIRPHFQRNLLVRATGTPSGITGGHGLKLSHRVATATTVLTNHLREWANLLTVGRGAARVSTKVSTSVQTRDCTRS